MKRLSWSIYSDIGNQKIKVCFFFLEDFEFFLKWDEFVNWLKWKMANPMEVMRFERKMWLKNIKSRTKALVEEKWKRLNWRVLLKVAKW